jgi:hypothetical protein
MKEGGEKNKQKSWHRTNIWPWVPAGLDAKSDRAGWLAAVSYCSALLLQRSLEMAVERVGGWCEMAASLRGREPGSKGMSTGEDTADWEDLNVGCSELQSVN